MFQITTTDGQTHTRGDLELTVFRALRPEAATLESYQHEGDYVVLCYSQGLQLAIPERHIRHIVTAPEQDQAARDGEYVLELLDEDGVWMLRADYDDHQAAVEAMERETAARLRPHQVVKREVVATTDVPAH